ncbi:flagellar biosynthesis protein FlgB [Rhodovarius crocodyli]|jgi:flagellar basal-body rod protein FlgB|uniref:Flagellar basal body rod protein FlgB n=1 Tax=Rhodovarius crocodyli TaxID=1979269 RepID=A0A437LW60_9PROT|nr:flagellar basal body protein [Rhodovarius crocodyli]RVT89547.1 flagellar biosynthesis protein FlgB [Rhodovarius crocodyli]
MDITGNGPIALAERRLNWAEGRQRVLAQNIANADTPGYRAQDVRPFAQVLANTRNPPLSVTQPGHVASVGGVLRPRADRNTQERTPDGNTVSLDEQALRMADTNGDHELAMNLHRKYLTLFRTALGRTS